MEKMVEDESIDHVLMILDRTYKAKADERRGGVGTEAQILTAELYSKVDQTKFIPVLAERDEAGEPFAPVFLKNRIYVDLSEGANYEDEYRQLVRFIYKRPLYQKPELGRPPAYLSENRQNISNLDALMQQLRVACSECKPILNSIILEFGQEVLKLLEENRLFYSEDKAADYGKLIMDSIDRMTPIRDSFVDMVSLVARSACNFDYGSISTFFERAEDLFEPPEGKSQWYNHDFDNFAFLHWEMILHSCALYLTTNRFDLLSSFCTTKYLVYPKHSTKPVVMGFAELRHGAGFLEGYYNKVNATNYISASTEILFKRTGKMLQWQQLVEIDLLLRYISTFQSESMTPWWFPATYPYVAKVRMDCIRRLISLKHFLKLAPLFGTKTKEEFVEKLSRHLPDYNKFRHMRAFDTIPQMSKFIKPEEVCTIP